MLMPWHATAWARRIALSFGERGFAPERLRSLCCAVRSLCRLPLLRCRSAIPLCRPVRLSCSRRQRSVHECEAAGTVIQLTEQLDIDLSKKWKERERQSRAVSPEWHGIEWPLVLPLRLYARSRQYSLSSRHWFAAVYCTLRSSLSSWTSVCAKALTALPLVSLSARVHPCL